MMAAHVLTAPLAATYERSRLARARVSAFIVWHSFRDGAVTGVSRPFGLDACAITCYDGGKGVALGFANRKGVACDG
jgi:hypothetical protein